MTAWVRPFDSPVVSKSLLSTGWRRFAAPTSIPLDVPDVTDLLRGRERQEDDLASSDRGRSFCRARFDPDTSFDAAANRADGSAGSPRRRIMVL